MWFTLFWQTVSGYILAPQVSNELPAISTRFGIESFRGRAQKARRNTGRTAKESAFFRRSCFGGEILSCSVARAGENPLHPCRERMFNCWERQTVHIFRGSSIRRPTVPDRFCGAFSVQLSKRLLLRYSPPSEPAIILDEGFLAARHWEGCYENNFFFFTSFLFLQSAIER